MDDDDDVECLFTSYADVSDFECLSLPSLPFFKVIHLNIRSLNKNSDSLTALLALLKIDFDLIVLSELWIYNLHLYQNILPGYNFHYVINQENQCSGIGIYISTSLNYKVNTHLKIDGCEYLNVFVHLNRPTKVSNDLTIHCVYRHPGGLQQNFIQNLDEALDSSDTKCKHILIGDLNINLLDTYSQSTNDYLDLLMKYHFLPLILTPTRITHHSSSLIDHIMFNGYTGIKSFSGTISSDITDHLPVYAFIPLDSFKAKSKERPYHRKKLIK